MSELLKMLDLKCEKNIEDAVKRKKLNFISGCVDKEGKEYIFKVKIADSKYQPEKISELKIEFSRELYFYNEIKKKKNLPVQNIIPNLIQSGSAPLKWILYKKVRGNSLVSNSTFPIPNSISNNNKIISNLVENILKMQEINHQRITDLRIFDFKIYKKIFNQVLDSPKNSELLSFDKLKRALDTFESKEKLFNQNLILTHGDLNPGNIIVNQNKIVFIDWEKVRFDNIASDLAFLWVKSALSNEYRNKIILKFSSMVKSKEEFNELFRFDSIIWLIHEINWWEGKMKNNIERPLAKKFLSIYQGDLNKLL